MTRRRCEGWRCQFVLACLIVLASLPYLLPRCVLPYFRERVYYGYVRAARSKIDSLVSRVPPGVAPERWGEAVHWTSNLIGQVYFSPDPGELDSLKRLCKGLDERLSGKVRFSTLQWVWEHCEESPDRTIVRSLLRVRLLNPEPITDERIPHLWGLRKCTSLDLSGTAITNSGLEHLESCTKLATLTLEDTEITDAGLEELKRLPQLRTLSLRNTLVSNEGLRLLKCLTNLESLDLSGTHLSDGGLRHLAALSSARELQLDNTATTDSGLAALRRLTNLRYLSLKNTQVTDGGVEALRQALPKCAIEH